mmetsp:Transcript_20899/g.67650  ORF Transcript_20899/g.67650 Transcript_20899/m.67650 type:complete len:375 (+) Transcript_20899:107-1231(+)
MERCDVRLGPERLSVGLHRNAAPRRVARGQAWRQGGARLGDGGVWRVHGAHSRGARARGSRGGRRAPGAAPRARGGGARRGRGDAVHEQSHRDARAQGAPCASGGHRFHGLPFRNNHRPSRVAAHHHEVWMAGSVPDVRPPRDPNPRALAHASPYTQARPRCGGRGGERVCRVLGGCRHGATPARAGHLGHHHRQHLQPLELLHLPQLAPHVLLPGARRQPQGEHALLRRTVGCHGCLQLCCWVCSGPTRKLRRERDSGAEADADDIVPGSRGVLVAHRRGQPPARGRPRVLHLRARARFLRAGWLHPQHAGRRAAPRGPPLRPLQHRRIARGHPRHRRHGRHRPANRLVAARLLHHGRPLRRRHRRLEHPLHR